VIPKSRGINSPGRPAIIQFQLGFSGEAMSYLLPVDKILAVKNRHPRKKLKTAVHQVKIIPDKTNAGIRMKSGNDRILVSLGKYCLTETNHKQQADQYIKTLHKKVLFTSII
jgi:hypothetical protein